MNIRPPYQPHEAEVIEYIQESASIFTLRLRFTDPNIHQNYHFSPGQFNMLYLFGIGEIPISIVSDPEYKGSFDHTIRRVGRVSNAFATLQQGDKIGIRGPYGRGWPIEECGDRNILLVTGGLGCAPSVSVIRYILNRRDCFGTLTILQGVKKADDLIWREQYEQWSALPNTQVLLAADVTNEHWPWAQGPVIQLFDQAQISADNTIAMMCGPERMMTASANELIQRGFNDNDIWLSMERNMQCAVGHCGHCQYGHHFICRHGPVFSYRELRPLLGKAGY